MATSSELYLLFHVKFSFSVLFWTSLAITFKSLFSSIFEAHVLFILQLNLAGPAVLDSFGIGIEGQYQATWYEN
jgi:hypothetical protein